MAYTATQADLNILRQGEQEIFLKVELLNSNFKVIDSLTGNIKSDTYSVDSESIQRRSYKADIVVTDDSFQIGRDKKYGWISVFVFFMAFTLCASGRSYGIGSESSPTRHSTIPTVLLNGCSLLPALI